MAVGDASAPETVRALIRELTVDRRDEVPIGVQLGWALRARIADGRLAAGERLPGLREVAEATGVNVNTVRATYQRLESAGLIVSEQGRGTFVGHAPPRRNAIAQIARSAAEEARATGIDPREVAAALYVSRERPAAGDRQGDELERRRLLRGQIGALERAVSELESTHPDLASPPPKPGRRPAAGPSLPDARELEGVRTELLRRLTAIQTAIDAEEAERAATATARRKPAASKPARARQAGKPARPREQPAAPSKPAASKPAAPKRPSVRPAPAGT